MNRFMGKEPVNTEIRAESMEDFLKTCWRGFFYFYGWRGPPMCLEVIA